MIILVAFLVLNMGYLRGLRLSKGLNEYSESEYSDMSKSKLNSSELISSRTNLPYNAAGKPTHRSKGDKSEYTSQVESDEDENDEPSEVASRESQIEKSQEAEEDRDYDVENESSQIEDANQQSEAVESNQKEMKMPQAQYMARQQRFNLASTVYPASDVSNTNYVFLSPAAQKRIDMKIATLQKRGRHHGSMRETRAIGEWQRRYYSRPATEYGEVRTSSLERSSTFTWVVLGCVLILVFAICLCGVHLVSKG